MIKLNIKTMIELIKGSILSGICISLGGAVNLMVGGPLGAILFAFGLLSVIYYSIPLYTGRAGFFKNKEEFLNLFIILLGNIIGCLIIGLLLYPFEYVDGGNIIFSRIEAGYVKCLCGGILCGIIMSLAVKAKDQPLLTLFGIPLFILCGFYHSIADAFYSCCTIKDISLVIDYLPYWGTIIIGNFIGCNIPTTIYSKIR